MIDETNSSLSEVIESLATSPLAVLESIATDRDEGDVHRIAALCVLQQHNALMGADLANLYSQLARDDSSQVANWALFNLRNTGTLESAESLKELANSNLNLDVVGRVLVAISQFDESFVYTQATDLLKSNDIAIVTLAAISLAQAGSERCRRLLLIAMKEHADDYGKWAIASQLGKIGEIEAVEELTRLLDCESFSFIHHLVTSAALANLKNRVGCLRLKNIVMACADEDLFAVRTALREFAHFPLPDRDDQRDEIVAWIDQRVSEGAN